MYNPSVNPLTAVVFEFGVAIVPPVGPLTLVHVPVPEVIALPFRVIEFPADKQISWSNPALGVVGKALFVTFIVSDVGPQLPEPATLY